MHRSVWDSIRRQVWELIYRSGAFYHPISDAALVEMARLQGASIIYSSALTSLHGCLSDTGAGLAIRINRSLPRELQRFTLAHEIGHTIIDGDIPCGRSKLTARVEHPLVLGAFEREQVCDRIASELLIPEVESRGALEQGSLNDVTTRFAAKFEVPPEAAHTSLGIQKGIQFGFDPFRPGFLIQEVLP
jgi:hypothetical protein